jgi:hypothetical protein
MAELTIEQLLKSKEALRASDLKVQNEVDTDAKKASRPPKRLVVLRGHIRVTFKD